MKGTNIWSNAICIPRDSDISYRYLQCSLDPITKNVYVRRWETHLKPRTVHAYDDDKTATVDTFGEINGIEKVDRGWLTNETVIQFKFFNNPFKLKQKLKNRLLYVKVGVGNHIYYKLFNYLILKCFFQYQY